MYAVITTAIVSTAALSYWAMVSLRGASPVVCRTGDRSNVTDQA